MIWSSSKAWHGGGKIKNKNRKTSAGKQPASDAGEAAALQEGLLPSSLPLQAQIGGKKVMVFQAYDGTRTTLNSSVLKYSVCEDGVWSEPRAVDDNGSADLYADMKVVGGQLVLVWQKEKKAIAGDVETDSPEVLRDLSENAEIVFSVFDEDTAAFGTPVALTDNSLYDMMPRICNDSGEVIVSWVRNDAADIMQETGTNTIYASKWNGTSFEEEKAVAEAPGTIDDYVAYENEEGVQAVFIGQADGIAAVFDTDGNVSEGLEDLMVPSADDRISGLHYADGAVTCIANGTLYSYDTAGGDVTSSLAGESAFGAQVQYCTNGEKSGYLWSLYDEETDTGRITAEIGRSLPMHRIRRRTFTPCISSPKRRKQAWSWPGLRLMKTTGWMG